MADAESPDEPLPFACTDHVAEPERATVPNTAATMAVEAWVSMNSIARGR